MKPFRVRRLASAVIVTGITEAAPGCLDPSFAGSVAAYSNFGSSFPRRDGSRARTT
jgi:hypothetical protein